MSEYKYKVNQRYYDNGRVTAKLTEIKEGDKLEPFAEFDTYDEYVDQFEDLEEAKAFHKEVLSLTGK